MKMMANESRPAKRQRMDSETLSIETKQSTPCKLTIADLPKEILGQIFSHLSKKETAMAAIVCKSWFEISRSLTEHIAININKVGELEKLTMDRSPNETFLQDLTGGDLTGVLQKSTRLKRLDLMIYALYPTSDPRTYQLFVPALCSLLKRRAVKSWTSELPECFETLELSFRMVNDHQSHDDSVSFLKQMEELTNTAITLRHVEIDPDRGKYVASFSPTNVLKCPLNSLEMSLNHPSINTLARMLDRYRQKRVLELKIHACYDISDEVVKYLKRMTALKELTICEAQNITPPGWAQLFDHTSALKNLTSLCLDHCYSVESSSIRNIAKLCGEKLQTLVLYHCDLPENCIIHLKQMRALETFVVAFARQISAATWATMFDDRKCLPQLKGLEMLDCNVDATTIADIIEWSQGRLKRMQFDYCDLTDDCIKHLKRASLFQLELGHVEFSCEGWNSLFDSESKLKSLSVVIVHNNVNFTGTTLRNLGKLCGNNMGLLMLTSRSVITIPDIKLFQKMCKPGTWIYTASYNNTGLLL